MATSGKVGAVYMQTTAASTAFTTEATTATDGTYTRYYITNRAKAYFDKNTTTTVYVNAVPNTANTVEYPGGFIEFDSALIVTDVVTVTGAYWTVSEVAGFFNWSIEPSKSMEDITTFADSGWKVFLPTLSEWTASAEKFYVNNNFTNRLGNEVVIVLYTDDSANLYRYEGFAKITNSSIEDPVDGIINESIEFTGDGKLYYREG